jgi:hypothetical protein
MRIVWIIFFKYSEIKEGIDGLGMWQGWRKGELWLGNLLQNDHLEDQKVYDGITLN